VKNAVRRLKIQEDMIRNKLKQDSIIALKNHDSARVDVLRFLISLIDKKELQLPPGAMTEVEELGVLRKELKNKEESKEMFAKANREDLVKQIDYEIKVVKEYLPQEVSEEKVAQIVDEVIEEKGTNFGLVMKEVMSRLGGSVGGDVVSRIVKEKLNK
jgi:uncharacterized protein YqeY